MHIFEGDTRNFDIISSECYTKEYYGILRISTGIVVYSVD